MYTLDTNAIIYYAKNDRVAVTALENIFAQEVSVYISVITEIELYSLPQIGIEQILLIRKFVKAVTVVPLDSQLAQLASEVRRLYHLKLPDSVIAATALHTNSQLVTRNVRDFKRIPTLGIMSI